MSSDVVFFVSGLIIGFVLGFGSTLLLGYAFRLGQIEGKKDKSK